MVHFACIDKARLPGLGIPVVLVLCLVFGGFGVLGLSRGDVGTGLVFLAAAIGVPALFHRLYVGPWLRSPRGFSVDAGGVVLRRPLSSPRVGWDRVHALEGTPSSLRIELDAHGTVDGAGDGVAGLRVAATSGAAVAKRAIDRLVALGQADATTLRTAAAGPGADASRAAALDALPDPEPALLVEAMRTGGPQARAAAVKRARERRLLGRAALDALVANAAGLSAAELEAVRDLAPHGRDEVERLLLPALDDAAAAVRAAAAGSFAAVAGPEHDGRVRALLADPAEEVRVAVAGALLRRGTAARFDVLPSLPAAGPLRARWLEAAADVLPDVVRAALSADLRSTDDETFVAASRLLRATDTATETELVAALSRPGLGARVAAARAIARLRITSDTARRALERVAAEREEHSVQVYRHPYDPERDEYRTDQVPNAAAQAAMETLSALKG